jgi:nucleoid-associated protein YgaU
MDMEKTLKNILKKIKLSEPTISTILGALVILVVGILIFNYFKAGQSQPEILETAEETSVSPEEQEAGVKLVEVEKENGQKEMAKIYKVEPGDYLSLISKKIYGTGQYWPEIAKENSLDNPDLLAVGQELRLPDLGLEMAQPAAPEVQNKPQATIDGDKYTVVAGDHLWSIAVRAYGDGYKWTEIAQVNNLAHPDFLAVGQELTLPR